jgi:hypothetical protein
MALAKKCRWSVIFVLIVKGCELAPHLHARSEIRRTGAICIREPCYLQYATQTEYRNGEFVNIFRYKFINRKLIVFIASLSICKQVGNGFANKDISPGLSTDGMKRKLGSSFVILNVMGHIDHIELLAEAILPTTKQKA